MDDCIIQLKNIDNIKKELKQMLGSFLFYKSLFAP